MKYSDCKSVMEVFIAIPTSREAILKEDQMIVENILSEVNKVGRINVYWGKYRVEHPKYPEQNIYRDIWGIVYRIRTSDEIGEYTQAILKDMGYDTPNSLRNFHYLRRI